MSNLVLYIGFLLGLMTGILLTSIGRSIRRLNAARRTRLNMNTSGTYLSGSNLAHPVRTVTARQYVFESGGMCEAITLSCGHVTQIVRHSIGEIPCDQCGLRVM